MNETTTNITVKELRALLFNVDNQDVTVKELRMALFDYDEQDDAVTPKLLFALTRDVEYWNGVGEVTE